MIKVSVIVPIYNAEKYLEQCLDSVVNQTLKEIEIILIDDGSTDGSAEICKKYLDDERVTYFRKENEGLAAARDDGMKLAQGEYIGFVDSDDWSEPDMYDKMYTAAKTNDSDIVFCNCMQNENGYVFTPEMPSGAYDREKIKSEILPHTLAYVGKGGNKRALRWSNCLRLYKKELLDKNGIKFDRRLRRSQDLQLTYEATLVAQNYYYIAEPLYHNRVVADSLSRGYTKNMWPLYTYLIEILYKDTENFKELDLMDQMHLRAFFFATDCIENEMKPLCPNNISKRIELINEVINDPICERFKGHIQTDKLSPLYRKYYEFIVKKKAEKFIPYTERYKRNAEFRGKYINPLIDALTENNVYKTIRGKR
ncbi:MAG: glycosyltransferase [Clostridia bacterium]|nr:glycosyltransferase [Clostridia bacterium]